jgi:hypothetical protein
MIDGKALMCQVIFNRGMKAGMRHIMGGGCNHRFITARKLMLALCTGFDRGEAALYARFNRLVVTELKM